MKKSKRPSLSSLALLPCLLPFASGAEASVSCSPTASATAAHPGEVITLRGNCVDSVFGPVSQGNEVWQLNQGGSAQLVGRRSLPNGTLSVTVPVLAGELVYSLVGIDDGYGGAIDDGYGGKINLAGEGGYPQVSVTVILDVTCLPGVMTRGSPAAL